MITKTKKQRLDEVKDYINEELNVPFFCEWKVREENGNIIIETECWEVTLGINDEWFNVSTEKGCGISTYELDQIVDIRDNKETILEIYNGEGMMTVKNNVKPLK